MDTFYQSSDTTNKIIKAYYRVYNKLGYGFLEKLYERALIIELEKMGLDVKSQYPIKVYYDDNMIGSFVLDLLVNDSVIVEIKAIKQILPVHEVQLVNYLKATALNVGLLLNFGEDPEIKRKYLKPDNI